MLGLLLFFRSKVVVFSLNMKTRDLSLREWVQNTLSWNIDIFYVEK